MAKNRLLGSGVPEGVEAEIIVKKPAKAPAWRYHVDCPKGRVFKTDEALAAADASGWKDHPGKVQLLPGHEGLFEADKESNIDISEKE